VKQKRKDAFDPQRYRVFLDNYEITDVRGITASLTADEMPLTTVNIQLLTTDFQWVNEGESVEPLADGPTDNRTNG
jgi:hypothetical protein